MLVKGEALAGIRIEGVGCEKIKSANRFLKKFVCRRLICPTLTCKPLKMRSGCIFWRKLEFPIFDAKHPSSAVEMLVTVSSVHYLFLHGSNNRTCPDFASSFVVGENDAARQCLRIYELKRSR